MKTFGLLLLILILFVHTSYAQHTIQPGNRKLSPALQKVNTRLINNNQEQTFWIVTSNTDSARNYFNQHQLPVHVTGEYTGGLLVIKARRQTIDSLLLNLPFVQFIDAPRHPKEELALSSFDNSLNTINLVHSRFPQVNGNTLVVSVKENKLDTSDIDFTGRYLSTPLSSPSITSHASIMATIIAGGENSFYTSGGAAPAAVLTSSDFANLLPDADNSYRQYGISVQNHSYGTGVENYYGADAAAFDASINNNPGLMDIFSAGNSGSETSSSGAYSGIANMANLTGSFKMAKNIITVGATDSFNHVAFLSSKGPAYDGRVKPELVAFGQDGSSGAAALTSGAALLLQHQYKLQSGGTLPSSALIKAILLNSANDIYTKGPDFQSGYGSLNAYKAMQTLANAQYYSGSVTQGNVQSFSLTVPANTRELKITLCWNDPAAVANAPKALINDLDLQLVNNGNGQTWQPWVLNSSPVIDSLLSPAVRKRDSLNNVEQISIDTPAAGVYTIQVKGFSIPSGSQAFFVAWQTDANDQFQWQFPVSGDYMTGGQTNLLRWSSTFSTNAGLLEYSLDKGTSWQALNTSTVLADGNLYWNTPDTFCTALLRMTINGQVFTTDTFTISSPLPVKVGFNCADSVMLYWKHIPAISSYAIYRLGDKYLQPVTTITDTSIILHQPASLWYAVAPVIGPARQAMKSYTLDYQQQGVACYLETFLADLVSNGNAALLTTKIGTVYNVKSITLEKLAKDGFHTLQVIQPVTNLEYEVNDNNLADGTNTYRAKIELINGQAIYSDPASVYYFLNTRYIIFPNPVKTTGTLQVFTKQDPQNTQLLLYNALGQKVLQYNMTYMAESIPLAGLKNGIYFIVILKNGKKDFTGKVMVQ
jgi:hypothetical protein